MRERGMRLKEKEKRREESGGRAPRSQERLSKRVFVGRREDQHAREGTEKREKKVVKH